MKRRKHRGHKHRGYSLIELLITLLVIGIIASILIPNLLDSVHRSKQRKTMGELNLIGTAWMSWLTDQAGAGSAGASKTYDTGGFIDVTYAQLYEYLRPSDTFFYMQEVPEYDPWGSSYIFKRNTNLKSDRVLFICAPARDLAPDLCTQQIMPIGPFSKTDFETDIIWADGNFVSWPLAVQAPPTI